MKAIHPVTWFPRIHFVGGAARIIANADWAPVLPIHKSAATLCRIE